MNSDYHDPVLLHESVDGLNIKKSGIYVDATFGGGGHSSRILKMLDADGRLIGFDQDADAKENSPDDERFTFAQANFRHLKRYLKLFGIPQADGILADLGVSSFQLNEPEKGFSYRFNSPLDMRMDQEGSLTAATILNTYDATQLQQVFSDYGEIRNSRSLATAIVQFRGQRKMETTNDLLNAMEAMIRGKRERYLSQLFQALRIEVNDEIGALKDFLTQSLEVLAPGGRLVVIAYHSLEDRLVKNFLKKGVFSGEPVKDDFGNIFRPFRSITKKAVSPSDTEIKRNPRARSARMRIAEKLTV